MIEHIEQRIIDQLFDAGMDHKEALLLLIDIEHYRRAHLVEEMQIKDELTAGILGG